ncbi:MAG TPA: acyl carrier protein [Allosphingosinicella sp.]|jgi:acyl carrier protein
MIQTATLDDIAAFVTAQLLQRVEGLHSIDPDTDLMELGVRSIDAVLVSGEIEDHYGVEVDPVLLFEYRTVNRVAGWVAESLSAR